MPQRRKAAKRPRKPRGRSAISKDNQAAKRLGKRDASGREAGAIARRKSEKASKRMLEYNRQIRFIQSARGLTRKEAQDYYRDGARGVRANVFDRTKRRGTEIFRGADKRSKAIERETGRQQGFELVVEADKKTGRRRPNPAKVRDRATGRFVSNKRVQQVRKRAAREAAYQRVMEIEGVSYREAQRILKEERELARERGFADTFWGRFESYIYRSAPGGEE